MNKKYISVFTTIGLTGIVIGAITQIMNLAQAIYIFSFGALVVIVTQFFVALEKQTNNRKQRLTRMSFISSLFLGLAAYFMFIHSNSWVVAVLIYALTTLYLSFRNK